MLGSARLTRTEPVGAQGGATLSYGLCRGPSLTYSQGAVDWNLPGGGNGDEEAGGEDKVKAGLVKALTASGFPR